VNAVEDVINNGVLDIDGVVAAIKDICKTLEVLTDPACDSLVDIFVVSIFISN